MSDKIVTKMSEKIVTGYECPPWPDFDFLMQQQALENFDRHCIGNLLQTFIIPPSDRHFLHVENHI